MSFGNIAQRPNGKWRARYRDQSGKEHANHFDTKTLAKRWLQEVNADLVKGTWIDPKASKVTFREYAESWLSSQTFDANTREAVESRLRVHILPFFGDLPLGAIKPSTVQHWLRSRQEKCAPTYVRVMLANLSSILGSAVDDERLAKNPCSSRSVRAPRIDKKEIVPWTQEQVDAVLDALPERYLAIAALAAGCGLRQGEAFGVAVQNINFLQRELNVKQQIKVLSGKTVIAPPKLNKERTVPLPNFVGMALSKHIERFTPDDDGIVFLTREKGRIHRDYFNTHVWKPTLRKVGIEPTRENGMHALRHYYASVTLDGGTNIRALADYLGHSDPGFTLRVYTHLMPRSDDQVRRVVDAAFDRSADSVRTEKLGEQ